MFRAGTTLLSRLLDQDARNRGLLMWEAGDSIPPPTPATHRSGPRVDAVHAGNAMLAQINPMIEVVHHEQADEATECITVMAQDFKSLTYEAIANVPGYHRWLMEVDQRSAYEYHRSVLQVLQSAGVRGRWTLKSPHHAIALEHLTAVYPDARLVLLHRDPVVLTASVCSLITTLSSTFTDVDHRAYIAEHWPAMLETSIGRVNAFRDAHPDHSDRRRAVRRPRDRSDRYGRRRSTPRAVTSSTRVARPRSPGTSTRIRGTGSGRTRTTSPSSASTPTRSPNASPRTSNATTSGEKRTAELRRQRVRTRGWCRIPV